MVGADFADNAIAVDAVREGVALQGRVSLPSFSRANALQQYAYVNGRPVRDKLIAGAIRGAFADVLPRDRNAVTVLFLTLDPADVDVNVHPAKADVRFRDPGLVRGLIVGAIREALAGAGIRAATTGAAQMMNAFRAGPTAYAHRGPANGHRSLQPGLPRRRVCGRLRFRALAGAPARSAASARRRRPNSTPGRSTAATREPARWRSMTTCWRPGWVRHARRSTRTTSSRRPAIPSIIVDQHAAHERLVYEALKQAMRARPLPAQMLLLPEIVDLPEDDASRLATHAETLRRFGLGIERFGPGAIAVRETPAMLGETNVQSLIRDLADEIADNDTVDTLQARLDRIAATMACHGSVRSGRQLRPEEMNALLRQMEATPGSGTCNHGRPTYIELKLSDIERLFGRR